MPAEHKPMFEVDEDPRHQQAEWRFEQAGWVLWAVVIVLAAAGLLGPGPLSSSRVTAADGSLAVEYHRFIRRQAESELTVRLSPSKVHDGAVRLRISRADNFDIDRIQPEPRETIASGGRVLFVFAAEPGGEVVARFRFKPVRIGVQNLAFAVEGAPELHLWILTLP